MKSIEKKQLKKFSELNIITVKDILKKSVEELFNITGISKEEILTIKNESEKLLSCFME
ncbi:MAG: hypothetical protein QW589_01000 [Candidatus Bathyarchaeia archaeon]